MIAAAVIIGLVGALLSVIGYLIWKKEMISLLHEYHYDRVTPEDKKAFCALSGMGILTAGAGLILSAIALGITGSPWGFSPLAAGLVAGLSLIIRAVAKYNRR